MLVFRNKFGSVMFQGQLLKNVSKYTKKTPAKPQKVQRMITVAAKKEGGAHGLVKCTITFREEPDCVRFRETFARLMAELPEIVKPVAKAETKKETEAVKKPSVTKKESEKKEPEIVAKKESVPKAVPETKKPSEKK